MTRQSSSVQITKHLHVYHPPLLQDENLKPLGVCACVQVGVWMARFALWCGVVWCGVVWCGVVWCGVVWCSVVWCGVVWCGAQGAVTKWQWPGCLAYG